MNFIGMKSKLWKSLIPVDTAEELVQLYNAKMELDRHSAWDYDQLIISRILLEDRMCWASSRNNIWNLVKLEPVPKQYDQRYAQGYVTIVVIKKLQNCFTNPFHVQNVVWLSQVAWSFFRCYMQRYFSEVGSCHEAIRKKYV